MYLFPVVLVCAVCAHFATSEDSYALLNGWPVCANATFMDKYNLIDAERMLYECASNIPSSQLIPSYFRIDEDVPYYPVNITIQVVVNNLISVDDITSSMTMDMYLRLTWVDSRWNMPELFPHLNPECTLDGVDITQFVRNSNNALNVWLPDVVFTDDTNDVLVSELVKIKPKGVFYWSRHRAITFAEPQMSFAAFPLDHQNFSLRMQSFSYDSKFVNLTFADPPVTFNNNTQQNTTNVQMNALWIYDSYSAYITDEAMPNTVNPTRHFFCANVNLRFTRQALGIIYRLALPVTIFSVIVGLSFWADVDKRIEVTLQMLLVVAALYLIIGQSIPFVGYLTTMDAFVTLTFGLLSVAIGMHFITLLFERKKEKYPLNELHRDVLVYFFRTFWIPCAFLILVVFFDVDIPIIVACTVLSATVSFSNAYIKRGLLETSFHNSIVNLRHKAARLEKLRAERKEEDSLRAAQGLQPLGQEGDDMRARIVPLNWNEELALHWTRNIVFKERPVDAKPSNSKDMEEGIEMSGFFSSVQNSLSHIVPALTPRSHRHGVPKSSTRERSDSAGSNSTSSTDIGGAYGLHAHNAAMYSVTSLPREETEEDSAGGSSRRESDIGDTTNPMARVINMYTNNNSARAPKTPSRVPSSSNLAASGAAAGASVGELPRPPTLSVNTSEQPASIGIADRADGEEKKCASP